MVCTFAGKLKGKVKMDPTRGVGTKEPSASFIYNHTRKVRTDSQ